MTVRPVAEIIDPGLQTTVQEWPGRTGLTSQGFFPAGPMDHVGFRAANVLVGNTAGAPALEIPKIALTAAVLADTQIAVTGPDGIVVLINDRPVPAWQTIPVRAGDMVRTASAGQLGFRSYLAVRGGFSIPSVYGSAATSLIVGIGGVEGRALLRGDLLAAPEAAPAPVRKFPDAIRPRFSTAWEVEILAGPHAAPDWLTLDDWRDLCSTKWRVDLNSDRVGTRLHPHRFTWARSNSVVAGGHPSNVLDEAYPVGGLLANGDILTILGMDSNTSGGFAVVATVPHCALWKIGQLRPGRDTITFRQIDFAEAVALNDQCYFMVNPRRAAPVPPK